MKKSSFYKFTSVLLAAALLTGIFIMPVSAADKTVINVTETNAMVTRSSTVYAGKITLDGENAFTYLYSEDISITEHVMAAIRVGFAAFAETDFTPLVPEIAGETDDKGFVSCSDDEQSKNAGSGWVEAKNVAAQLYPDKTVNSYDSYDLYDNAEDFAAACRFDESVDNIYDNVGTSFTVCGPLGKLSATNTDTVTYTAENGKLIKYVDRIIDYTCESVTVIYTTADLSSNTGGGKIKKTVFRYSQTGTDTEELPVDSDIAAYIAEKKSEFESALPSGSGDTVLVKDGYEELFTGNTYAEYAGIEYLGTSYKFSNDAIFIGDLDDFENAYVVSGTVTREMNYNILYTLVTVTSAEETGPEWTPGDINGDGSADNKDVVSLFRYHTGFSETVVIAALDCSGDGCADNKDVTVLFRYVSTNGRSFISDKPYIKI